MCDIIFQLKTKQSDLEAAKKEEKEAQDKIDEDAKHLEKFASKQSILEQKVADCREKISQLGALPAEDLYSLYVKMSSRAVSRNCNVLVISSFN